MRLGYHVCTYDTRALSVSGELLRHEAIQKRGADHEADLEASSLHCQGSKCHRHRVQRINTANRAPGVYDLTGQWSFQMLFLAGLLSVEGRYQGWYYTG